MVDSQDQEPHDLPRVELLLDADKTLRTIGGGCVYFKFTCPKCGERCTFEQPNTLYEIGECCRCGHSAPVTHGGYLYASTELKPSHKNRQWLSPKTTRFSN